MTSTVSRLSDIDLIDPALYQRGVPHDTWTLLRHEAPVFWHEGKGFPGFWAITRYDDIIRISRDPLGFISGKGVSIETDATPEGQQRAGSSEYGVGQMMLTTDPPRHVQMRRLVNKSFTPRQVRLMEPHVRELVRGIVNEVCERGEADFVEEISAKLPVAIICEMMGVPRPDWHLMFDWTNRMIGAADPEFQAAADTADPTGMAASGEMFMYFQKMMEERARDPKDDLMTTIMNADIEGEKLSHGDVLLFGLLLIVAGNETTRNATSGGMLAFFEHPEQREKLARDPTLMPVAIEEILRWVSPVMNFARICTADTEIRGQKIRAGEKVVMFYPSGNRDEEIFPDPFRFDITRTPNEHVAFGMGEHYCLGAHLARLELTGIFEGIFTRLPDLEPAGEIRRLRSNLIAGIKHMPVRWTPTPQEAVL